MQMVRCQNGHLYDPDKHRAGCPHCPIDGIEDIFEFDSGKTEPKRELQRTPAPPPIMNGSETPPLPPLPEDEGKTRRRGQPVSRQEEEEAGATVGVFRKQKGIDPVVGWLICIEGKDRGRDYRIRSERNFIGRAENMDICIKGDETISREKHAAISFDPRHGKFRLLPGDNRGLVYLNENVVDMPTELKAYDRIELGQTKLMFVPLCGEHFKWE